VLTMAETQTSLEFKEARCSRNKETSAAFLNINRWVGAKKTKFSICSPGRDLHKQGHQYICDGCSGLIFTESPPLNIFVEHNAPAGRAGHVTGSGRDTGAAARRGHDDMRRRHHRIHLGGAATHLATAAHPATPTSVCSCLVDARSEGATAARSAMLRASEDPDALGID
jgi:hypothetical protein